MLFRTTSDPLEDIEFLVRSKHRVAVLDALTESPATREDLRAETAASPSTISRTVRAFEERNWISRNGDRYEATQLGAFVATGMRDLIDRLETERTLRDVWQWFPSDAGGFTVEMVADATVTVAESDAPYAPVNRFLSLLRETDQFRFVGADIALLEPCKDELRQQIVSGMQTSIIDPPSVAEYILSTYRDHCSPALERRNFTVKLHDDLPPYGVSLFDDRIAVSCYDPDSGMVRAILDTDDPVARDWAESIFESYHDEARPLALEGTEA
ncbi:helix-turn-helix transcriptional regulator [Halostagnicola kamekurae]|uniref:Predicted transcriptional regulator, contains HTH domain n=1 Tax=Halostagnicola kamekurae TaxID=619731 RepID=A0A1I6UEJ4_9EURY|nr:MarR family transcriptional regulator [Halostagnicola kamekurae]SFS99840.1 Predicted transcriptional regulator, contains HTH domain [Halostagnicola kamekurae]